MSTTDTPANPASRRRISDRQAAYENIKQLMTEADAERVAAPVQSDHFTDTLIRPIAENMRANPLQNPRAANTVHGAIAAEVKRLTKVSDDAAWAERKSHPENNLHYFDDRFDSLTPEEQDEFLERRISESLERNAVAEDETTDDFTYEPEEAE